VRRERGGAYPTFSTFTDNGFWPFPPGTEPLAAYLYDALGRRVKTVIGSKVTHYYYDGHRVIEEYTVAGGVESLSRYHINGGQYIDERIASFEVKPDGSVVPTCYLAGDNYSVIGTGDADGQTIRPLNYSPTGQFSDARTRSCNLDQDSANDVDADDFAFLEACFSGPDVPVTVTQDCQIGEAADIDREGDVDGPDYIIFQTCMSGPDAPASAACLGQGVSPEDSGIAAMHGLTVDVLPDGKTLLFARARHYDPKHGRWLQRDPAGFVDGPNPYEAFGGNPASFLDPSGMWITARVAEITRASKRALTLGDIQGLGEELHARESLEKRISPLTDAELRMLKAYAGGADGSPFTAATLTPDMMRGGRRALR
jgi:RHS repeat-associated protein